MNVMGTWILKQMRDAEVRKLFNMPDDQLKALWDRYDGSNAPDGYCGENIHMALNMKGLGAYCAV